MKRRSYSSSKTRELGWDKDRVLIYKWRIQSFQIVMESISPKDPSASTYVKHSVAAALNSLLNGLLILPVPAVVVEH